jgi:hypothetical protein
MATSPDMILTVLQNGVTAINNLSNKIGSGSATGAWKTYTPSVTAVIGTFTTVSATERYKQIGTIVCLQITVTLSTKGTGQYFIVTLPVAASTLSNVAVYGREDNVTGNMVQGRASGTNAVAMFNFNNSDPCVDNAIFKIAGVYESA